MLQRFIRVPLRKCDFGKRVTGSCRVRVMFCDGQRNCFGFLDKPDALEAVCKRNHNVFSFGKLVSELRDGRLDAAILALPVSEPGLTEKELFQEDFVLVRPGADRDQPLPSKEGLRAMRLLLLEEGHCFRDQALSFCEMGANRPREMLDGSSLSTLVQMVNAGIGVTLLPEMALGVETRSADVSVHRFTAPRPSRSIGMIWRASTPLAVQLDQLAEIVRDAATSSA